MTKRFPSGEDVRAAAHERVKAAVAKQTRAAAKGVMTPAKKKAKATARRPRSTV